MSYTVSINGVEFVTQIESQADEAKLHALCERMRAAGFDVVTSAE